MLSSRAFLHGFCTKSRAPRRIALDRHFDAAPRGHDDDRQRRVVGAELRQQVESLLPDVVSRA